MSVPTKIEPDLNKYYSDRKKNSDLYYQMGYKSNWAEDFRFSQLLKIIEVDDTFSINDLGCGNGTLLSFMQETIIDKSLLSDKNGY